MKLTKEQFEALAPYEENFRTANRSETSGWSRHPGSAALDLMQRIYTNAVGPRPRLNKSCSHCILSLIRDMGRIWLSDQAEHIAAENDRKAVELSKEEATVKKAVVKTTKRKTANKKKA